MFTKTLNNGELIQVFKLNVKEELLNGLETEIQMTFNYANIMRTLNLSTKSLKRKMFTKFLQCRIFDNMENRSSNAHIILLDRVLKLQI